MNRRDARIYALKWAADSLKADADGPDGGPRAEGLQLDNPRDSARLQRAVRELAQELTARMHRLRQRAKPPAPRRTSR